MSTTTTLTINVIDVIDPRPSFSLSEYTFYINEGLANVSQAICTLLAHYVFSAVRLLSHLMQVVVGRVEATESLSSNTAILRYEQLMKG